MVANLLDRFNMVAKNDFIQVTHNEEFVAYGKRIVRLVEGRIECDDKVSDTNLDSCKTLK